MFVRFYWFLLYFMLRWVKIYWGLHLCYEFEFKVCGLRVIDDFTAFFFLKENW